MWHYSESTVKPSELDKESSAAVVYVRRNITYVEPSETEEEKKPGMYQYEENQIPKADWELYEQLTAHTTEIGEVQDALIELADMIGG